MRDALLDDHEEPCNDNEPGLSSAMHDIRMIAKRYQDHDAQPASGNALELGGVSMNPSFLLVPNVASHRDSWKGVALAMMVLLGLSTSALALSLSANADEARTETAPLRQLEVSPLPSSVEQGPGIVMSPEPAIYSVASTLDAAKRPELRNSEAPTSARSATREVPAKATRRLAESVTSCDEVACLINGSDPCCQSYDSVRAHASSVQDAPARPYRPTRSQIMKPMGSISGRVEACSSTYAYQGVAAVKVVISAEGIVSSVELDDGSAAFQSCVQGHVSGLRFPELSQPFTFSYPFSL